MEWIQRATNPWGQEIMVRASWDLLWLALFGSAVFLLIHQVLRRRWIHKKAEVGSVEGLPEKVARHSLPSRLFHWSMAASMLVLLFTGFLPIVGIQFSWVTIHWWAGLVLIATVIFHIIHATVRWTFKEVWISLRDIRDWWTGMTEALGGSKAPGKPGKYPVDNKLYHAAIVLTSLGVIVTGILMMAQIDTPFFERDTYTLSEGTVGLVFVVHGLSAIGLVALVIAHIYFAILPEKRWMTMSMFKGWIGRDKYAEYYDSDRWAISGDGASPPSASPPSEPATPPSEPAGGEES